MANEMTRLVAFSLTPLTVKTSPPRHLDTTVVPFDTSQPSTLVSMGDSGEAMMLAVMDLVVTPVEGNVALTCKARP